MTQQQSRQTKQIEKHRTADCIIYTPLPPHVPLIITCYPKQSKMAVNTLLSKCAGTT